ncbi:MAG TPA: hypothetical protein VGS07_03180 [Thermoanaerobaculia bacterium]|jgi:hypothetical protein|nr:hypothetical protein [Thermoanaerobaculia bacterium]
MANGFLSQTQLELSIANMAPPPVPQPPPGGQAIIIVNQTQFSLSPIDQFFDSGEFAVAPLPISPFNSGSFIVTPTSSGTAGVTGAVAFTFEPLPSVICNLGAGFGNPLFGSFDCNVAFDADHNQIVNSNPILPLGDFTQGTYNANSTSPVFSSSTQYAGTDTNGSPTIIQITGNSTPAFVASIIITQTIVSGGQ